MFTAGAQNALVHGAPDGPIELHACKSVELKEGKTGGWRPSAVSCRRLPSASVDCRRLPSIAVDCRRLPSIGIDCCRLPSIVIDCCRLPLISVDCRGGRPGGRGAAFPQLRHAERICAGVEWLVVRICNRPGRNHPALVAGTRASGVNNLYKHAKEDLVAMGIGDGLTLECRRIVTGLSSVAIDGFLWPSAAIDRPSSHAIECLRLCPMQRAVNIRNLSIPQSHKR